MINPWSRGEFQLQMGLTRALHRADELVVFVSGADGYSRSCGSAPDLVEWLLGQRVATRVSVLFDPSGENELYRLLSAASDRGAFDDGGALARASFRLHVVTREDLDTRTIEQQLGEWLLKKGLMARFTVSRWTHATPRLSASRVNQELAAGRLDPIVIASDEMLDGRGWRERQSAGIFLALAARHDRRVLRRVLDRLPVGLSPQRLVVDQWRGACSILNAIENFGRPQVDDDRRYLFRRLSAFADTLDQAIIATEQPESSAVLDLAWRFTAAAASVVNEVEEFKHLLAKPALVGLYQQLSFLAKELVFYASRSPYPEATVPHAISVLEGTKRKDAVSQERLATRLARLHAVWQEPLRTFLRTALPKLLSEEGLSAFREESERCDLVNDLGLSAALSRDADGRLLCTYLFLRTAGLGHRDGLVGAVDQALRRVLETPSVSMPALTWRGDKTFLAQAILSEVSPDRRLAVLGAMAVDEDETIRWAALVMVMDPALRLALLAGRRTPAATLAVRGEVASVV